MFFDDRYHIFDKCLTEIFFPEYLGKFSPFPNSFGCFDQNWAKYGPFLLVILEILNAMDRPIVLFVLHRGLNWERKNAVGSPLPYLAGCVHMLNVCHSHYQTLLPFRTCYCNQIIFWLRILCLLQSPRFLSLLGTRPSNKSKFWPDRQPIKNCHSYY